jgi:hypothetical protein
MATQYQWLITYACILSCRYLFIVHGKTCLAVNWRGRDTANYLGSNRLCC